MLTAFRDLLEERRSRGAAAAAFTCYTLTTAIGVVRAAEAERTPAILLVAGSSHAAPGGDLLVAALRAVVERARVPLCLQLDHVGAIATVARGVEDGVNAVMADGSRLPYDENIELVRNARELAGSRAGVEAELGHVAGGEDVAAAAAAGQLTDPDDAAAFVDATGVDCLAVSIGNVHGHYAAPPALDWQRLERIRERVGAPLSLHGASGLSDGDLGRAVAAGIAKVNLNTELRRRLYADLERGLPETRRGLRLLDLERALADGVAEVAAQKLRLLADAAAAA
jgi:tagatose 1,6-diphosphate aldolase GatY/KbaY